MARDVVLIAGPTASGKSAYALDIARQTGGAIINSDSMQVYDVLQVITARPSDADMSRAPHHLYGHVQPSQPYSTGHWLRDVESLMNRLDPKQPLIFVGGTGLYFRALSEGLSPMPSIDAAIRNHWRARLDAEGAPALHTVLAERDADAASALEPADGQRIVRALEVLEASGKPIGWWQAQKSEPLINAATAQKTILLPDRAVLHERINQRFADMANSGAVQEVQTLMALELEASLPAMKAIGVREIAAALAGDLTWDDAITQAQAATRQYAKRQMTWFRQQMDDSWTRITPTH